MKTYYKNDLKQAYLILESGGNTLEDYQVCMLQENEIRGLLPLDVRYVDNVRHYYYNISGKVSLKAMHEKVKLTCEEIQNLIESLLYTLKNIRKYMLEGDGLLLQPEYIFCERDQFFFCYLPQSGQSLIEEFHSLTEYFVREVNYQDEEGVRLAYTMHKATMEENYSIEKIMEQLIFTKKEEKEIVNYEEKMEEKSAEEMMLKEKRDLWEPVKRFLEKRRKDRGSFWEQERMG